MFYFLYYVVIIANYNMGFYRGRREGIYSEEIFLYLLSLSHDSLLAEDLVQETFLKAILSLDEKHPNIRAWLYRVARNLYFNEKKKLDRNVLTDSFDENIKDEKADSLLEKFIDSQTKKNL